MSKARKASKILESLIDAGYSAEHAASVAEAETGLPIVPAGPVHCLQWTFFVISRKGKRVVGRHRVYERLEAR